MVAAIADVKGNGISVREASKKHNIPKSTLARYVVNDKNGDEFPCCGPKRVFSSEVEKLLVKYILDMSDHGIPFDNRQILTIARNMVLEGFKANNKLNYNTRYTLITLFI